MTYREAAIVTIYTNYLIGDFSEAHKYAQEIYGGPIWSHQFGDPEIVEKLRELSKEDYVKLSEMLRKDDEDNTGGKQMKGFIEVTDNPTGEKYMVQITHIRSFMDGLISIDKGDYSPVKETRDEIKARIEAVRACKTRRPRFTAEEIDALKDADNEITVHADRNTALQMSLELIRAMIKEEGK